MPREVKLLKTFLKKQGYVQVKLKKAKTEHLLMKGAINGIEAKFLLDTGASGTVMDLNQAEKYNLTYEKEDKDEAAGLTGNKLELFNSEKTNLFLNDFEIQDFSFKLIDLGPLSAALAAEKVKGVCCIVGADILDKYKAIIDYTKLNLFLLEED